MTDTLTTLQQFVYFTFIISFFGMAAGSVYFFSQKSELPGAYKQAVIISGVITMVAALTYFYMKDIYLQNAISSGSEKGFPTEYRYIDWLITVPLMLIKFPVLLGMGDKGRGFMIKLVVCSLAMLIFSFVGEVNFENKALHFGSYGVSVSFWLFIIFSLNSALRSLPESITEAKRTSIRRMFIFIFVGWIIYPLGYLMPTFGLPGDYRELIYNIGDIINKVGLGLVVVAGGYRSLKEDH